MAEVVHRRKNLTVNPLKLSQPLGAALAFLGLDEAMPVFHGVKGCASFGMVTFVKHFREAIPFQSTALDEVATIMGGHDNLREAIVNVKARTGAKIIGICTTALAETRGEDFAGDLKLIRESIPGLDDTTLILVSTPDYAGAFEDGWAKAALAIVSALADPGAPRNPARVNLLPGSHLTAGDIDELREMIEAFGLEAGVVPDISGSLDGHMPDEFRPLTLGGATRGTVRSLGGAALTIAVGEQMRPAAAALEARAGVPFRVFERLSGLAPTDRLVRLLAEVSGRPVPPRLRRDRSRLVDAMLDAHFHFGDLPVGIAGDPDLIQAHAGWLGELGARIETAVATTRSPVLERIPTAEVVIGDLRDFEERAAGCRLLLANTHGRHAAGRLGIPLFRIGYPVPDRLGPQSLTSVGYRGTRSLIFAVANLLMAEAGEPGEHTWTLAENAHEHLHAAAG